MKQIKNNNFWANLDQQNTKILNNARNNINTANSTNQLSSRSELKSKQSVLSLYSTGFNTPFSNKNQLKNIEKTPNTIENRNFTGYKTSRSEFKYHNENNENKIENMLLNDYFMKNKTDFNKNISQTERKNSINDNNQEFFDLIQKNKSFLNTPVKINEKFYCKKRKSIDNLNLKKLILQDNEKERKEKKMKISIHWKSEINNDYFKIEKKENKIVNSNFKLKKNIILDKNEDENKTKK